MAKITNAFTTYSAQGNREDLSNTIYNISPSDTPFMTLAGKRNVSNRTFDWQTESLAAVDAGNAREDGFQLVPSAAVPTVRKTNVTQISSRDATVSGSQQASNAAGKKNEMSHHMALAARALKRDMETILCGNQARVDGNDAGVARKTEGFEHALLTNVVSAGDYVAPASQTAAGVDGTLRPITDELLSEALLKCYENGAEPTDLLVGPAIKQKISKFVGREGINVNVSPNEIVTSFDVYKSDFGTIKVRPSRWVRARTALLIDPAYVKVAYFRNFETKDMPVFGDAETKMILAEYGLEVSNEAAHGKITDIQ